MNEITLKIKERALETFRPIAEKMAYEGKTADEITAFFHQQVQVKASQYYANRNMSPLSKVLQNIDFEKDSTAESIFYDMLISSGLNIKFQRTIGAYRADYLINDYIVVELDGPDHDKNRDNIRDKYMRKMGYKIIRVPLWVLELSPQAVIDELKEACGLKILLEGEK